MNTDLELSRFYSDFFKKSLKLNKPINLKAFKCFLSPKQQLKKADNDTEEVEVFEADDYHEKFAHLFENSLFTSSAVAALFKDLLDKNANLLSRLIEKELISICCFSDGTCAEVVAIVQVLDNAFENFASLFRFEVTVVCCTRSWKKTSLKVLQSLEKYKLDGEHVKFININVSEELPDEVQQVIKTSKIVTIVKFLSQVQNCQRRFWEVYNDIFQQLQPESIVFFLDCAERNFISGINRQLSSCLRLYHSPRYLHILNLEAVKNGFKPFDGAVENYFLVKLQIISFGFWVKVGKSASHAFNVRSMAGVSVKTDRSVREKYTPLQQKSSKKYISKYNMEESSSAKNDSCYRKANEPIPGTSSTTKPLVKGIGCEDKRRGNKKGKVDSEKMETNMTDINLDSSSKLSRERLIASKGKKKVRKGKLRVRRDPRVDETVPSIVEPENQYTCTHCGQDDTEKRGECKICCHMNLKSSKPLKVNDSERVEAMMEQEESAFLPENIQFSHIQSSIEDNTWNTVSYKTKLNIEKKQFDVSVPESVTFFEKSEKVDSQKKKRRKRGKSKNKPSVDKTVFNISEQKHPDTPKNLVLQNSDENDSDQSCHPTAKLSKIRINDRGKVEKSLTEKEESVVLSRNIGQPQTIRNMKSNASGTEPNKTEFSECDKPERNSDKKLLNICIPESETFFEESEKVDPQKKRRRKKEKCKNKPPVNKTVSHISEQKHPDTPKDLVLENSDEKDNDQSCHPTAKLSKIRINDGGKVEKSLTEEEESVVLSESIGQPLTIRNLKSNASGTEPNKTEFSECNKPERNSDKKLLNICIPENETFFEKSEKIDPQEKRRWKKEKYKNKRSVNKTISNISEQKHPNTPKDLVLQNSDEIRSDQSCHPTAKSSKIHIDDGDKIEKSIVLSENIRQPETIGNMKSNALSAEPNKTEFSECDIPERNRDKRLLNICISESETFFDKSEKVDPQKKSRRKKEKCKNKRSVDKTVSNISEQKHPDTPKDLVLQKGNENGSGQSCRPTIAKPSKIYKNDSGQIKKSSTKEEKSTVLPENIGQPQTIRNMEGYASGTESNKTEFSECDIIECYVDNQLRDISIPISEEYFEKSEKVDPQKKKRRKKGKSKNNPLVDKTVSNISEQKDPDTSKDLVHRNSYGNGSCQNCLPTTAKASSIHINDRAQNEKSLSREEKLIVLSEDTGQPQTIGNIEENASGIVPNETELAECDITELYNDKKLPCVCTIKSETFFGKSEKVDLRIKKRNEEKYKNKSTMDRVVFDIAEQKHSHTRKDIQQSRVENGNVQSCHPTTEKSTNFDENNRGQSEWMEQGISVLSENIGLPQTQRNMGGSTRGTLENKTKIAECDMRESSTDKNLHDVSARLCKAFFEKSEKGKFYPQMKKRRKKEKAKCEPSVDQLVFNNIETSSENLEHYTEKARNNQDNYVSSKIVTGSKSGSEFFASDNQIASSMVPLSSITKTQYQPIKATKLSLSSQNKQPSSIKTLENVNTENARNEGKNIVSSGSATTSGAAFFASGHQIVGNVCSHETIPPVSITEKHFPFKKATKPHHSSQMKQRSDFEAVSENPLNDTEKARNKEENIVIFGSATTSITDIFIPDHQTAGNIRSLKRKPPISFRKNHFPFTKTKPPHSSQMKQISDIKAAFKNRKNDTEKYKEGSILSSKSGIESDLDFFPDRQIADNMPSKDEFSTPDYQIASNLYSKDGPDHQIAGNILMKKEGSVIQGTTMVPKQVNSFDAGYPSRRMIVRKQGCEKPRIISLTNKSGKSLAYLGQTQAEQGTAEQESVKEEMQKEFIVSVGKESKDEVSDAVTRKESAGGLQFYNEKDDSSIEFKLKKLPVWEREGENKKKFLQSSFARFEFVRLPHAQFTRRKEVICKQKKKKTNRSKKGKDKSKWKVLRKIVFCHSENLKYEFINEDLSLVALAADYSNTFLTKVNLVLREDIVENKIFIEMENAHQKQSSESNDRILYDCMYDPSDDDDEDSACEFDDLVYCADSDAFVPAWLMYDSDDDDFDSLIPAFNQSSSKSKRWDYWWKKWNLV